MEFEVHQSATQCGKIHHNPIVGYVFSVLASHSVSKSVIARYAARNKVIERKERDWAQTNSYFILVIDRHQMFVSHCKNRFIRVFERDATCLTEE